MDDPIAIVTSKILGNIIRDYVEGRNALKLITELTKVNKNEINKYLHDYTLENIIKNKGIGAYEHWMAIHSLTELNVKGGIVALLQRGADINCKTSKRGLTPLHIATLNENGKAEGMTEKAIWWEEQSLTKFLLKKGANPNAQDNEGITPLLQECIGYQPNKSLVIQLISEGASCNPIKIKDPKKKNHPLGELCGLSGEGYIKTENIVKLALEKGANPNEKSQLGLPPLHIACSSKSLPNPNVVGCLLENGADPNIQDNDGVTPLQQCLLYWLKEGRVYHGGRIEQEKILKKLLDAGANAQLKDNYTKNCPLEIIERIRRTTGFDTANELAEVLKNHSIRRTIKERAKKFITSEIEI